MYGQDMESLKIEFNTAYYLAKKERPFTDLPDLLSLQKKKIGGKNRN